MVQHVIVGIQLGELVKDWPFVIVNGLSSAAALGADFLWSVQNCGVANGEFYIGVEIFRLLPFFPVLSNQMVADIQSQSAKNLLPCSSKNYRAGEKMNQGLVELHCTTIPDQQLLFEGESLPDDVLLSKTLVGPNSRGKLWVRAINLNEDIVTLFSKKTVGQAEAAVPVGEKPGEDDAIASLRQLGIGLSHTIMMASERRQLMDLLFRH